jgi:DNA polymerase-3 subunit epsilon
MLYPFQVVPDNWDAFYSEQATATAPDFLSNFYQSPLAAQQTMGEAEFVAIDIETTGLKAQQDDIISIGLVPFNARRIYLSGAHHWLVRPRKLTSTSVVIHQITHSDVAEAPTLRTVLPEVIPLLKNKLVVVHYRYMEREFFRQAAAGLYEQNWLFPVIDTLEIEAMHLRQQQSRLARLLKRKLPSLRLPNVRERYHLPAYENHNALTDALATAELLQAQIARQALSSVQVRDLWY